MANWGTDRNSSNSGFRLGELLIVVLLLVSVSACRDGAQNSDPETTTEIFSNIVFITADTTRKSDLSLYGGPAQTPNLEALASDGTVFTAAHSVAFGTTPSHASLMTSNHPRRHGVYDNETVLPDGLPLMAEVLHNLGYATAGFVSAVPVRSDLGFSRGMDLFSEKFQNGQRRAEETVDSSLQWLVDDSHKPYFMWIHLFDPHQPYDPPVDFQNPEVAAFEHSNSLMDAIDFTQHIDINEFLERPDNAHLELDYVARARYRGEIRYLDDQIGRILDALRESGDYDDTLVVFVADHGENFVDPEPILAFMHSGLHRNVTNVPLIIKFPGTVGKGLRCDGLIRSIDIPPTVFDAIGLPVPDSWKGTSFLGFLSDDSSVLRDYIFLEGAHRHEVGVRTKKWLYREIRHEYRGQGDKIRYLAYKPGNSQRLYFLPDDPEESTNLADTNDQMLSDRMERFSELANDLASHEARTTNEHLVDREHLEGLRALGYAN